jgi:hypothetical protein
MSEKDGRRWKETQSSLPQRKKDGRRLSRRFHSDAVFRPIKTRAYEKSRTIICVADNYDLLYRSTLSCGAHLSDECYR